MADNNKRRRRRPAKKGDAAVTTGQAQPAQQQQAAPAQQGAKGGKGKGKGKGGAKPAQAAPAAAQPKAQPKAQAKGQAKGQGKGKGSGKKPAGAGAGGSAKQQSKKGKNAQKPQKQARQQKNQKNANKPGKVTKQGKSKVSEDAQRQKRKQEEKQRKNLIIKSKFQAKGSKTPSTLETNICEHLVQLSASNKDFTKDLRALGIVGARPIEVAPGKKAICVLVPYFQHARWQKVQDRVSRELEKKFSGQDVIFVAQRKVMHLNEIKNNYPRPRNQTITSVHEQILDDVVFPTRIVGKRTRFRVGGKRILKVYLDPKDSKEIEPKLATYEAVYRKLTKKNVRFMFPRYTI